MNLETIYNRRVLLVDLGSEECEEIDLDESLVEERIGGAAVNLALYERYREFDPVVIGTGPLTATFAPASCLAVATGRSPLSGAVGHVPLTWLFGAELKLSGFDFVVLMSAAEVPFHLWLHDEIADLERADVLRGRGAWEIVDALRLEHGDEAVQILTVGPAAEGRFGAAALSENYWGSADKIGLGARLGMMNLKAIAARGLGSLEVAEGFFDHCTGLRSGLAGQGAQPPADAAAWLRALGVGDSFCDAVTPRVHRLDACHACPAPCKIYLMTRGDPAGRAEEKGDEPGVLVSDLSGLLALERFGAGAPALLERALKLGVSPNAVAMALAFEGAHGVEAAEKAIDRIAAEGIAMGAFTEETHLIGGAPPWPIKGGRSALLAQSMGVFSNGIPPGPIGADAGAFGAPEGDGERAAWWVERQAAAYILGICPIYALAAPALTPTVMADLAARAAEDDTLDAEKLASVGRTLIKETLAAGKETEVSEGLQYEGFDEDRRVMRSVLGL